jgi:hypothetical protein
VGHPEERATTGRSQDIARARDECRRRAQTTIRHQVRRPVSNPSKLLLLRPGKHSERPSLLRPLRLLEADRRVVLETGQNNDGDWASLITAQSPVDDIWVGHACPTQIILALTQGRWSEHTQASRSRRCRGRDTVSTSTGPSLLLTS